jgi:DNA-binding transcriptional LysR family regulator
MEINHLRHFYEVAQVGSFTGAARKLRVSQSTLSKSVALLENHEGVKLFQRFKKGVILTEVGQEVFKKSQSLFQVAQEIEDICRGQKDICSGHLRMSVADHAANYLLTEALIELKTQYPKVIPTLFTGPPADSINAILNNETEIGLFFTKILTPGIEYEQIRLVEMRLVCHPQWVEKNKNLLSPKHFKKAILEVPIISSVRAQHQKHPSQPFFDMVGGELEIGFEANSQETQKKLCLAGGGVSYLASFMVEDEINSKKLISLPLPEKVTGHLHVAYRKESVLSLNAKTFINLLKSHFKANGA